MQPSRGNSLAVITSQRCPCMACRGSSPSSENRIQFMRYTLYLKRATATKTHQLLACIVVHRTLHHVPGKVSP